MLETPQMYLLQSTVKKLIDNASSRPTSMPSPIAKRTESQTSTPKLDRNQAKVKHSLARKRGNKHLSFLLLIHNGRITFFVKSQSSVSRFSHFTFFTAIQKSLLPAIFVSQFFHKKKRKPQLVILRCAVPKSIRYKDIFSTPRLCKRFIVYQYGHLNSIQVGSNRILLTAGIHIERKPQMFCELSKKFDSK